MFVREFGSKLQEQLAKRKRKPDENYLYRPTPEDTAALAAGARKLALHNMKLDKLLDDMACPFCSRPVYKHVRQRYYTMNGSPHKCIGLQKHDE